MGYWIFCAGMLFQAMDKWWDGSQKRRRPHEGLDLCLYGDCRHKIFRLDKKTKIPAMYDGAVVRIFNDFLGKSIIMEHHLPNSDRSRLLTIYGHTNPRSDLGVGSNVLQGEIIATLADTGNSRSGLCPHLHVTIGWSPEAIPYDNLDWTRICDPNTLTLLDPLNSIDRDYRVQNNGFSPCRNLLPSPPNP